MICKPCRNAADMLVASAGKEVPSSKTTQLAASILHEECKGCDCQHSLDVKVGIRTFADQ